MGYTAKEIIQRRKTLWERDKDELKDRAYRDAAAEYMTRNEALRQEIKDNPEHLIEMVFVIVDKDKRTVPFFLNEVQLKIIGEINRSIERYNSGEIPAVKILLLKGRQQGATSVITAYQLARAITNMNFEGFTAADEDSNTNAIFENKAKYTYNKLPPLLKPTEKYNNRKQLLFEKLHSSWEIKTAGSQMGRSRTINFFHGSECAFWRHPISSIQAGLGEALTKDSIQILESTANGYNEFKDLWDSGKWVNLFFQWWQSSEYRRGFMNDEAKAEFENMLLHGVEWIHERCRWLLDEGLDLEQVHWYYIKWDNYLNKDLIKQEYPCTDLEAFLSSGKCIFDQEVIVRRIAYLKKEQESSVKQGHMVFEWDDPETKNRILCGVKDDKNTVAFEPNPSGYIKVYEEPKPYHHYVIGGDTKGDGSDKFALTVIENSSGKRVATLHGDMSPDYYAHQAFCLGKWYNDALMAIEVNFDIYPVEELKRLNYPKQYLRKTYDKIRNEFMQRYGWKTDSNTRPMIIDKEIVMIRDHIELFTDIDMLKECLTFVYDKNMRPDAESGKHDDLLFSDMIAEAARDQQKRQPDDEPEEKTLIQKHKDKIAKNKSLGRKRGRLM